MLQFNKEQEGAVLAERMAFNAVQKRLAVNSKGVMTGNAYTLPRYLWESYDAQAVEIQRDVLAVFADLSGLRKDVPIGPYVHYFQTISDSGEVNMSIDGRSRAKTDRPVIDYEGTPLPIYDTTFGFGWRQVEAARNGGAWNMLDTAAQNNAVRKIAEKMEDLVINGDPLVSVGGDSVYGLRTAPNRVTDNFGNFDLATATGAEWVSAIKTVLLAMQTKNFYGNVTLYLNYGDWFAASVGDYVTAAPQNTILNRLLAIPGLVSIVPSSKVPVNEILAIVKRRDVFELNVGMPMVTRPLVRHNVTDEYEFEVMTAVAPVFKHDALDQAGYGQFVKGA